MRSSRFRCIPSEYSVCQSFRDGCLELPGPRRRASPQPALSMTIDAGYDTTWLRGKASNARTVASSQHAGYKVEQLLCIATRQPVAKARRVRTNLIPFPAYATESPTRTPIRYTTQIHTTDDGSYVPAGVYTYSRGFAKICATRFC